MYSSTRKYQPVAVWIIGTPSASITQQWELTAVVANTATSHLLFVVPQWIHWICRRRIVLGIAKVAWRKACQLRIYRWAASDRNATKHPAIRTMLQWTVTFQGVSCVCVFIFICVRDSKVESSVMSTTNDDLWKYSRFNEWMWGGSHRNDSDWWLSKVVAYVYAPEANNKKNTHTHTQIWMLTKLHSCAFCGEKWASLWQYSMQGLDGWIK
jgi:hypothetical protein